MNSLRYPTEQWKEKEEKKKGKKGKKKAAEQSYEGMSF